MTCTFTNTRQEIPSPVAIPTLGEWGALPLGLAMAALGDLAAAGELSAPG